MATHTVKVGELGGVVDAEPLVFRAAELSQLAALGFSLDDLASDTPPLMAVVWAAWLQVRRTAAPGLSWDDAQEAIEIVFGD